MAGSSDYVPVIAKLLQKTKDGKIEWKGTYESTTFLCILEGEYTFEIEKSQRSGGAYIDLKMKDREDGEVFALRAITPTADSSQQNDNLFLLLDDLYDRARRVALDIDKKVDNVS